MTRNIGSRERYPANHNLHDRGCNSLRERTNLAAELEPTMEAKWRNVIFSANSNTYVVMLSLLRLGDDAHGMTIRQDIEDRTERQAPLVPCTLDRLEGKG